MSSLRHGMFLSVGDESSTTDADTEMQLDRMRRKSGVVDLAEQLQSVQKARDTKAKIIQRSWRRYKVDKTMKMKDKAARCIQRNYRKHLKRVMALRAKADDIQRDISMRKKLAAKNPPRDDQQPKVAEAPSPVPEPVIVEAESTQSMEKLAADSTILDYGGSSSFGASENSESQNLSEMVESTATEEHPSVGNSELMSAEASVSVPRKSLLDIESEIVYEDLLKDAVGDLASQTFEDMLYQWVMIQNMFRKKGLVPAIDWLFTYFNRGEAYFWLDFLQEMGEIKVSFKWPDRYGGGFVFSSAGWVNAAPLQAGKRPERKPKAKRDRAKESQGATTTNGKATFGMNISSYTQNGDHRKSNLDAAGRPDYEGTNGMDGPIEAEDSEIAPLVSPFGTPSFISSQSPSRTGGFNTNATRPSTTPPRGPSSNRSGLRRPRGSGRIHCDGRTTRSSSMAASSRGASPRSPDRRKQGGDQVPAQGWVSTTPSEVGERLPMQAEAEDAVVPPGTPDGGLSASMDKLATMRTKYDQDRRSIHSAPSLPRSLERKLSPKLRPKWKNDSSYMSQKFVPLPDSLGTGSFLSPSQSRLGTQMDLSRLQAQQRNRIMVLEERGRRERLFNTVNSLNELQLNFTNELIDSVIKG